LDNAKEFRCEALRRGCEQYGIGIDYRPVRTPHYGGHIERLIGTMKGKVHLLPGTTFSDVRMKGDLDPEKTAAMTLEEVERWLGHAIAGLYHGTVHRALDTTPLAAWERGLLGDAITPGPGQPVPVPDPRRFLIDFLPIERRLIRREGVSLHSISYWSDILTTWIGEPEKMIKPGFRVIRASDVIAETAERFGIYITGTVALTLLRTYGTSRRWRRPRLYPIRALDSRITEPVHH
jgi:putative transposase